MRSIKEKVLIGSDPEITAWLRDRFGVDTDGVVISAKVEMRFARDEAAVLHVEYFVSAEDLSAFPTPSEDDDAQSSGLA